MTKMNIIFILLALTGCEIQVKSKSDPYHPISCDKKMPDWILKCVEKANPYSDEEPEDSISQCERTAVRMFCGSNCSVSGYGKITCSRDLQIGNHQHSNDYHDDNKLNVASDDD